jgi:hypothetical protein
MALIRRRTRRDAPEPARPVAYRDRRQPRPSEALAQAVAQQLDEAGAPAAPRPPDPTVAEATYAIGERLAALPEDVQAAAVVAYTAAWHVARDEAADPATREGLTGADAQRALAGVVRGGDVPSNDTLLLWAALRGYFHGREGRPAEDLVPTD